MRKKHSRSSDRKKDLAFHLILLAWPVVQFLVFYVFVNINSILLAFNYGPEANPNGGVFYWFEQCFAAQPDGSRPYLEAMGISFILYICSTLISLPLALLFAYYISRRFAGSKFFRFILFLPSILSATVMIIIFKYFNNLEILYFLHEFFPDNVVDILTTTETSTYVTIVLFDAFINFGTTTLIYSNHMSEIPNEIFEAAELDGVSHAREFFQISLPLSFPTFSTFIVTGLATIFVNQYSLFTFYGSNLNGLSPGPIGYVIYNNVQDAAVQGNYGAPAFHQMAALGLVCTFITIPLVFGVKYLLERFGPKEE